MSVTTELRNWRGHTLWPTVLGPESVVIDAGAHKGEFSRALHETFGCRCYMVEAHPGLATSLSSLPGVTSLNAALCARDGPVEFVFRDNLEAGSLFATPGASGEKREAIEGVTLQTVMRRFGLQQVDVLKLDVEGSEFELIAETPGEILASIGQITVEFHDFLPAFSGRGLYRNAKRRLRELGFVCVPISFRSRGDVLFLNRRLLKLGWGVRVFTPALARWFMKFGRRRQNAGGRQQ